MNLKLWNSIAVVFALFVLAPFAMLLVSATDAPRPLLAHVVDTQLFTAGFNSILIALGTGIGVLTLGVTAAWCVSRLEFPFQRTFEWLLVLPLAFPSYVLAFVYLGLLDYSGPLIQMLKGLNVFGIPQDALWLEVARFVKSKFGLVFVMSLSLYPYVYILARGAFYAQGRNLWEASLSLGSNSWSYFWRVGIPAAAPAIVSGLGLVLMESFADFGASSILGQQTLPTSIYRAWFGMYSLPVAAFLSLALVLMVLLVLWALSFLLNRHNHQVEAAFVEPVPRLKLQGFHRFGCLFFLSTLIVLGVGTPLTQLIIWAAVAFRSDGLSSLTPYLLNSIFLACAAAMMIVPCGLLLSFANRYGAKKILRPLTRVSLLGYAVPGTVLAVGVFVAFSLLGSKFDLKILSGASLLLVLVGYSVRFLAVAFNPIQASLQGVSQSLDQVSQSLGVGIFMHFRKVFFPLLKGATGAALLFVFVDVVKEMPLTLMTRPLGWDTLAVRVFQLTSEGEWERSALPALCLIFIAVGPCLHLVRRMGNR